MNSLLVGTVAGIVAAGIVMTTQTAGQPEGESLVVKRLEVRNDRVGGSIVLSSEAANGQAVAITLMDKRGEKRAVLELADDGTPSFRLADTRGKVRTTIEVDKEGVASIRLLGGDEGGCVPILLQSWTRKDGKAGSQLQVASHDAGNALLVYAR